MNLRRTLAISRRIGAQFRRDHRTLALLLVAPIVLLALLGWVIRDQDPPPTRLAVVNEAGVIGEAIAARIEDAATSDGLVVVDATTVDEARAALADDRLDVALVLPASLPDDVRAGRSPTLRVLTLGLSPADDAARIGELQRTLLGAIASGPGGVPAGPGVPPVPGGPTAPPIPTLEPQPLYGTADADVLDQFAPALIGFIGYFLVFILTGISFLRERVGGTLERLVATPIRRSEIVAGYSLGFGFFATLQVAVILAFALGSVEVPAIGPLPAFSVGLGIANAGSPALVFAVVLLLALGAVNLGIFLSTFARTEFQILQFIPLVIVPQGLLGGIFWPIDALPDALEAIARVLPVTYAIDGLREVLIKGADLSSPALQLDLAVLAGIAVVLVVLASATIRREVA